MRVGVVAVLILMLVVGAAVGGFYLGNSGPRSLTTIVASTSLTFTQTSVTTTTVATTITSTLNLSSPAPIPLASVETAHVKVGGSSIAVNPGLGRIYVANDSILTVIDAESHLLLAQVNLPASGGGAIAVDDDTSMVYVSIKNGVAEVNGSTNQVVGELRTGSGGPLAYTPQTHTIYVEEPGPRQANLNTSGYLLGWNVRTGALVANVSLGYYANSLAVNAQRNLVYALGCINSFVCEAELSILNGTSNKVIVREYPGSAYYVDLVLNKVTNTVYVAGEAELVAYGPVGYEIYKSDPQTCGPFLGMAVDPSTNQVLLATQNYDYVLAYDGSSLALLNMYALPSAASYVAANPVTGEAYVLLSGELVSFHIVANAGHVDTSLIGANETCAPP